MMGWSYWSENFFSASLDVSIMDGYSDGMNSIPKAMAPAIVGASSQLQWKVRYPTTRAVLCPK